MENNFAAGLPYLAQRTTEDILRNFWTGTSREGHFIHVCDEVLWELGMGIQLLESQYLATGDAALKPLWQAEWDWLQRLFQPNENMTLPDTPYNPACDDAAWSAMTLMSIFRQTGDEKALRFSQKTVRQAYDCWMDGDMSRGLWYRFGDDHTLGQYGWIKSSYCAGLMLSAIEQYELLRGTPEADRILEETLRLHGWVEANLRAEEIEVLSNGRSYARRGLYYTDYEENPGLGIRRPRARQQGKMTIQAGSDSALFGNTGLAAVNLLLSRVTGDHTMRDRAVETANQLALPPYNDRGVLLNDRDGWTDSAFMRYFVQTVLPEEGIDQALIRLVLDSGLHIGEHCRTEEGLYLPDWNGGTAWKNSGNHTVPEDLKTSATTGHIVTAANLCYRLGLYKGGE